MGKRDALIAKYADTLRDQCGMTPDMDLLTRVTIGCGPAIYDPRTEILAEDDPTELAVLRRNFVERKLGVPDGPAVADAVRFVLDGCGPAGAPKYRAVVQYMLTKHFGREHVFL